MANTFVSFGGEQSAPGVGGVLGNDTDADGGALRAVLVSGPAHGSLSAECRRHFQLYAGANWNGTDSFTYKANDGSLDSPLATVTITVNPANDAPTLGNGTLAAVAEDTANPAGQTVSTIFTGHFADVDAGSSFTGIAVVGNTANAGSQGVWQYSTNSGSNWYAIGTVADNTTALALNGSTLIRFVPVINYNGTPPALTVRGLDNTYAGGFSTAAGSESRVTVNTTANGGSTAIAAVTANLSTSITAVNDAPLQMFSGTNFNGSYAYNDFAGNWFVQNTPVNTGTIQSEPQGAVLHVGSSAGGSSSSAVIVYFDGALALGGFQGGGFSNTGSTLSMNLYLDTGNDGRFFSFTGNQFTGLDGDSYANVALGAGGGSFNDNTVFTKVGGIAALPSTFTLAQLKAGSVAGIDTNTRVSFWIGGGNAFSSDITSISMAASTAGSLTVPEDSGLTSLGLGGMALGPGGGADEAGQSLSYTVTAVPSAALGNVVLADGSTVVTASTSYSLAQIQGMQFQTTANANGSGANFAFSVQDNGGTLNGGVDTITQSITLGVTAVNDAPLAADDRPSLSFDGVDDYVSVPNSASLVMSATMTVEAWISPDVSSNARQMIANKEGEYELAIFADGSLNFAFAEGGAWNWHSTGTTISRNAWTHVAVTYDAGLVTTYVNGVSVNSQSMATTTIGDVYPGLNELRIGARSNNPAGQYFDGQIAEMRVWNVARSPAQIAGAMNSTLTGAETGLAGYWAFNDNTGAVAIDRTANANNGTLVNGCTWSGYRIDEDTVLNAVVPGVLANDYDAEGDSLTAVLVSGPANGSLTLNANGSFVYTPNTHWNGTDSFTYRANDGTVSSNLATVTVTVKPVNDAPTVTNLHGDSLTYSEGAGSVVIDQGGDALVNDIDSNDFDTGTLTVSFAAGSDSAEDVLGIRNQGTNAGQIGISGANVTFGGTIIGSFTGGSGGTSLVITLNSSATPAAVQALVRNITYLNTDMDAPTTGARTVRFVLTDGDGGSSVDRDATVTVIGVNDAPVANNDAYSVSEDQTLTISWWDTAWTRRQALSFDNSAQAENLTDFPVLVVLNGGNIDYSIAQDGGQDLRFVDADGTPLAYEIEQWNEAGTSYVWVKVPRIDASSTTDSIWMYYGNASSRSGANPSAVWNSGYAGVWHLSEGQAGTGNAGVYKDSTAPRNDGTDNVAATGKDGQIAAGQQFDGTGQWIEVPHDESLNLKGEMSISFWIKPTENTTTFNRVVEKGMWGFQTSYYFGGGNGSNDLTFYLNNTEVFDTADNVLTVGVWQQATVTYTSAGAAKLFLNGTQIASGTYAGPITGNTGPVYISHSDATYDFPGNIDEVRIENVARSDAWVKAQYKSMANTFVSFGGEQSAPGVGGVLGNDTDVDGGALRAVLVSGPAHGSLSLKADGTFSYTPDANWNGTDSFTYKANDGSLDSPPATVTITVNPANDAPTVANAIADQNATEDSAFSFVVPANTFADVDVGDTLIYSASGAPAWLTFNAATRTFSGTPANADVGSVTITVTADDGHGGTASDSFDIVVGNANDAPTVATPIADQNATEDAAFSFQFAANTFADVDVGDSLTYTASGTPAWLTFNAATRTFSGTPANADVGSVTITVTADDGHGGTASDSFDIVVGNANDAPTVATPIADQNATEDAAFSFQFAANTFADVDVGDSLTYTASGTPAWLTFNAATRTFSGTPLNADVGTVTITVTADDGHGGTASDSFDIVVGNANDAPTVANAIADQNATEDSAFSFVAPANTFADVDVGDTLTYSASGAPAWLTFNAATRTFSGTPANADVGSVTVTVRATDAGGLFVEDNFTLTVGNTNDAPTVATPIADQNATEDAAFSFQFAANTFADVDVGDTLSYTASGVPSWLTFNAATRTFSGTPANADVGSVTITVTADDGHGGTASDSFDIVVGNANDAPTVANAIADQNATEDAAFSFQFAANTFADVDVGDTLTYTRQRRSGVADVQRRHQNLQRHAGQRRRRQRHHHRHRRRRSRRHGERQLRHRGGQRQRRADGCQRHRRPERHRRQCVQLRRTGQHLRRRRCRRHADLQRQRRSRMADVQRRHENLQRHAGQRRRRQRHHHRHRRRRSRRHGERQLRHRGGQRQRRADGCQRRSPTRTPPKTVRSASSSSGQHLRRRRCRRHAHLHAPAALPHG